MAVEEIYIHSYVILRKRIIPFQLIYDDFNRTASYIYLV